MDQSASVAASLSASQDGKLKASPVSPGSAEQASGSAATKSGAHVGALAVLHEYQPDNAECDQNMHRQEKREKPVHLYRLSTCRLANRKKIVRDQRGATDQTTVDIGLGKQFRRVLRLDAATVQNTN